MLLEEAPIVAGGMFVEAEDIAIDGDIAIFIDEDDMPMSIDEEDMPMSIDEEDMPMSIDEEDMPTDIDDEEDMSTDIESQPKELVLLEIRVQMT